jgi:8-oxo-dGTP pyrophosphatase MutT (NUDIX family)
MEKIWYGSIVLAYRTAPLRVLLIENIETGNVTPVSGAVGDNETQRQAAARELREEINWVVKEDELLEIGVRHEFVYGPKKRERAGDKGSNQVFLLNANGYPEPNETNDTKNPIWLEPALIKEKISFEDLREVVEKSLVYI